MMRCRGRIAARRPLTGLFPEDVWSPKEPVGSLFEGWFFTALILAGVSESFRVG